MPVWSIATRIITVNDQVGRHSRSKWAASTNAAMKESRQAAAEIRSD